MSYSQKSQGPGNSGGGNNPPNQQAAAKALAGFQQQVQNMVHAQNIHPQTSQNAANAGLNPYANMYQTQNPNRNIESIIKQQQHLLMASNPQFQQHYQQLQQQSKEPLALTRTPGAAELLNKTYGQQPANGSTGSNAAAASIAANLVNQQTLQQLQAFTQNPAMLQHIQAYQYQMQQQQQQQQQQHQQQHQQQAQLQLQQQLQQQQQKFLASHAKAANAPSSVVNQMKPPNLPSSTQITPIPAPQIQSNNNLPNKGNSAKQISPSVSLLPAKSPLSSPAAQLSHQQQQQQHHQTQKNVMPILNQSASVIPPGKSSGLPPLPPQLQSPKSAMYHHQQQSLNSNQKPIGMTVKSQPTAVPLNKPTIPTTSAANYSPAKAPPASQTPPKQASLPPQAPPKVTLSTEALPPKATIPLPQKSPSAPAQVSAPVPKQSSPPSVIATKPTTTPVNEPSPIVAPAKAAETEPSLPSSSSSVINANVVKKDETVKIGQEAPALDKPKTEIKTKDSTEVVADAKKPEEVVKVDEKEEDTKGKEEAKSIDESKSKDKVPENSTSLEVAKLPEQNKKDNNIEEKTESDETDKSDVPLDVANVPVEDDSNKVAAKEPIEVVPATADPVETVQKIEKSEIAEKAEIPIVATEIKPIAKEKPPAKAKNPRQAKVTTKPETAVTNPSKPEPTAAGQSRTTITTPKVTPVKEKLSRGSVTPAGTPETLNNLNSDRKSKRHRLKTILYQSPLPELAYITKLSASEASNSPKPMAIEDKLIVFYKNEYMAVRNLDGGFFLCQTMQNVYRSSPRIRIRWLSEEKKDNSVYIPDFYDHTDIECVLTTVELKKGDKGQLKLPDGERSRIENILKKAIDVEKGILPRPDVTEENPDGLDISLYKDESQIEKKRVHQNSVSKSSLGKRKSARKSKSPKKKKKLYAKQSKRSSGNNTDSDDDASDDDDDDEDEDDSEGDVEYKPSRKRSSATTNASAYTQPKVRAQRSPLAKARAASPITPTTSRSTSSVPIESSISSTNSRNDRAKRRAVDTIAVEEELPAKRPATAASKKSVANEKILNKSTGEPSTSSDENTPTLATNKSTNKKSNTSSATATTSPTGRPSRSRK